MTNPNIVDILREKIVRQGKAVGYHPVTLLISREQYEALLSHSDATEPITEFEGVRLLTVVANDRIVPTAYLGKPKFPNILKSLGTQIVETYVTFGKPPTRIYLTWDEHDSLQYLMGYRHPGMKQNMFLGVETSVRAKPLELVPR